MNGVILTNLCHLRTYELLSLTLLVTRVFTHNVLDATAHYASTVLAARLNGGAYFHGINGGDEEYEQKDL